MYYSDFVKYKQYIDLFEKQLGDLNSTASHIIATAGDFQYISEKDFKSYVYHHHGLYSFLRRITDRCYLVRLDEEK